VQPRIRLVKRIDKIAEGFKGQTRARLAQNGAAGNAADLFADFADERRLIKNLSAKNRAICG